jgi:hypothetical protein
VLRYHCRGASITVRHLHNHSSFGVRQQKGPDPSSPRPSVSPCRVRGVRILLPYHGRATANDANIHFASICLVRDANDRVKWECSMRRRQRAIGIENLVDKYFSMSESFKLNVSGVGNRRGFSDSVSIVLSCVLRYSAGRPAPFYQPSFSSRCMRSINFTSSGGRYSSRQSR